MAANPTQISGILTIHKPKGLTSHDVVARIRKISQQRKVGHAGTLDPMATGVLVVCLGQATRLIEYLMDARKQYRATIRFGVATDTLDATGQVISQTDPGGLTPVQLKKILPTFMGEIQQLPPIFSAIKQGGQPLYKRARAGQPVEVAPRPVTIYELDWVDWQPPDLTLDVTCSAGTYIRALARDFGEAVQTGAHLAALTRTASGSRQLAEAVTLDDLQAAAAKNPPAWQKYLEPLDSAITHLPKVSVNAETSTRIQYGQQIYLENVTDKTDILRVYTHTGKFLAILTRIDDGGQLWQPQKVFISETD